MEIREYTEYRQGEVIRLYDSAGWTAYTRDPDSLRDGFLNSLLVLAAWEDGRLAGIIRAVGDGATIVYIQDLLVSPEHRRKGIGKALVNAVLNRYDAVRQIVLMADDTPETEAFYRSMGFREVSELGCRAYMRPSEK